MTSVNSGTPMTPVQWILSITSAVLLVCFQLLITHIIYKISDFIKVLKRNCKCHKPPVIVINFPIKKSQVGQRKPLTFRRAKKTNCAKKTSKTPVPKVDPKECPNTDPINSQEETGNSALSNKRMDEHPSVMVENHYCLPPLSVELIQNPISSFDIIEYPIENESD